MSYQRQSLGSADRKDSQQRRSYFHKMTQQMRDAPPAPTKKPSSPLSPSTTRRFYRNLSGKFHVGHPLLEEKSQSSRGDRVQLRKSTIFQSTKTLFEAVEQQELENVKLLLLQYSPEELDLNTPNSEGLLPLDVAIMTNNVPMARILLQAGAKESPHFVSLESRALHLATLVREAEQRVNDLTAQVLNQAPTEQDDFEKQKQLNAWEWRLRLFKRMQAGFEHARPPEAPSNVRLSVSSICSLTVSFQEPVHVNSAVVTKYRVEWSRAPLFSSVLGEAIIDKLNILQYTISGLTTGSEYYVRVSAYNMKGWSPAQNSLPACAAPSNWREIDGRTPRDKGKKEALEQLLQQVKNSHQQGTCQDASKAQSQTRKHSVSKSLRYLFQPASKYIKTLKRGLYFTSIIYRDGNVLVTQEEQIPIVEMDDSYSSSLMHDFLWFTKVSYLWQNILWLRQCISSSLSSCSCTLQTRLKMLQAVFHFQEMLGIQDLGQVYFEPLKDKHGNALIVTIQELGSNQIVENMRWIKLSKLQMQRKSISSPEEPTALDLLLITLNEKISYHQHSQQTLSPGLYLGYVKLCSSVDQIRVLVSQKLPNVLCNVKIRENHNVSREEWDWLQKLSTLKSSTLTETNADGPHSYFLQDIQAAAKTLIGQISASDTQVQNFRIYSQEVLEFGNRVSFLLLLPSSDEVCTAPGQNNPYALRSGFLTLPLQIFELVHFYTYSREFIVQYCCISAWLELESLVSQQMLREAFSETELTAAKEKHQQVQDQLQHMEDVWRQMRWIMDVLQYARYKQPYGGIPLIDIIGFTKASLMEIPCCTSSQLDFVPSPIPSPETHHKYTADTHAISEDEESCEVFLAPDSDCHLCHAQSTRQIDLLSSSQSSSSTAAQVTSKREDKMRSSAPDVLSGHKLQVAASENKKWQPELFDSEFILPSRQIELLRITEKRQAFCVRTSSLNLPPASPESEWCRAHHSTGDLDLKPALGPDNMIPPLLPRTRASEEDTSGFIESSGNGRFGKKCSHVTLRVYPQYRTGLSKETSVKLCVTRKTSARKIIRLVVQEINEVSRQLLGSLDEYTYSGDQLDHFGLVLVLDDKEKWLQDEFQPLALQNPWTRGKLCVRIKEYSPLSSKGSQAATV
ncbi:ankyrin repeat and fibronectin type-III domain-containing protein 1 isoform X2 [Polypterus senegalus]|uniref:ankyrin repeat and fibronectin type-III domain-containing protein 1 isoform X2 n=1 Tax=Polypterus senegalus TaxID=55291 RepID=UPI00196371C2|nr:ankyrin repeat and fibronectin type-III domain-containing protein 1 isoform X2 [Polypterus senegalus]